MWCSFIRKGKYCLLGSWNSKPQKEESLGRNTDHYGCSSSSFIFQLLQLHSAFWLLTNFSKTSIINFSSVQFSRSVVSDLLRPHELQHARPPCPSPTPGVHPNPCPSSRWCHPTISSSVVPFSSCPQSFPASGSFQMSQLFTSGG